MTTMNDSAGMTPDACIYVAGYLGLVGSAILCRLQTAGFTNLLTTTHQELDLTNQAAVNAWFAEHRPSHVILAAARVGGIHANSSYPADFIRDNLLIQTNIIDAAYQNGAKKLLFLGSSCIYPKLAPQPIREESLLTGPLEPTNGGMPWPRLPASSCARPTDANMASMQSA